MRKIKPPLAMRAGLVGLIVGILGLALADVVAPRTMSWFWSGIDRMFLAAVGLVLGPAMIAVAVHTLATAYRETVRRDDMIMAMFILAFGGFATWVFFFR